jgi:hypothetical protein
MCCLGWRQLSCCHACSMRAALASTLARATVWREAAHVLPLVAAAEPSPCSLDAGCAGFYAGARHDADCAGFYAGARHGVARGGTCAASGGGSWTAALLARCGLRWLLRWRAPRCGEGWHMCCLRWRQLSCCPACSMRAALASSWRAPRCGERRHMCCLGWRQLSRHPARVMRAALASTLARATVWREAARMLPRVAEAELLPCSLDAGCAGFYAGARHGVARGGTCAALGGGS